jgi:hypothetical protein
VVAKAVNPLVDGSDRPLDAQEAQERLRPSEQRPCGAREQRHCEHERRRDEDALDPQVGAHVVPPDREREPDRGERQGRRAAERALEQDDARHPPRLARVPPRRLQNPQRVAADRRREYLARRV